MYLRNSLKIRMMDYELRTTVFPGLRLKSRTRGRQLSRHWLVIKYSPSKTTVQLLHLYIFKNGAAEVQLVIDVPVSRRSGVHSRTG